MSNSEHNGAMPESSSTDTGFPPPPPAAYGAPPTPATPAAPAYAAPAAPHAHDESAAPASALTQPAMPGAPSGYAPQHPEVPPAGYAPQHPGHAPAAQHPGYAPGAGYGPPQHSVPRPPTSGAAAWGWGFLVWAPIPFIGAFASGIAMALAYGPTSKRGPLARENARAAANWGLTFTLVSTALLVTHFVLLFTLTRDEPVYNFYPLGIPITFYGLAVLLHAVLVIVGTVRASRGKVTKAPSIPFIRP